METTFRQTYVHRQVVGLRVFAHTIGFLETGARPGLVESGVRFFSQRLSRQIWRDGAFENMFAAFFLHLDFFLAPPDDVNEGELSQRAENEDGTSEEPDFAGLDVGDLG